MSKVLVAGVAVLDFVFHMDDFPRRAEKYRAVGATISGGGNAANAAVALARLGGDAYLSSRLGDDEVAQLILAGLTSENVNTDHIRRFADRRSSFSSIYIDASGERQIMNYRDNDLSMDGGWFSEKLSANNSEGFATTLADTRWPDGARIAMEQAKLWGIPGIIDAEAPVMEAKEAVYAASHVAFSAQGVKDFTQVADVEAAALAAQNELPGKVLVTDGANGTVTIEDGKPVWHPSFSIKPVDTLGAGDVWHGAFALALGEGMSEPEAIGFANAAAAIKCTRTGGRDGAPNRAEVTKFLEENT